MLVEQPLFICNINMIRFLYLLSLTFCFNTCFAQSTPTLNQAVTSIKKFDCILLFFQKQIETTAVIEHKKNLDVLLNTDFEQLDQLFDAENNIKVRVSIFFTMCSKFRDQLTEKHFKAFESNETVEICSGRNTEKVPLNQLATYLYENSKPRLENIKSPDAFALFQKANDLNFSGPVDFELMLNLLNQADSIEPNNPIIIEEIAETKWNFELDMDGALIDFQRAIDLSKDTVQLERRYHNRGLTYLCMEDIESACKDWEKAGISGQKYIEQYCHLNFEPVVNANVDSLIQLYFKLFSDTVYITHACNGTEMTSCQFNLIIENRSHPELKIKNGVFDFGLENGESELFLEAIDSSGKKFQFVSNNEFFKLGKDQEFTLAQGMSTSIELDITKQYHFPMEGKYRVRIVLRPTKYLQALTKNYYSDWQELNVIKRLEKRAYHEYQEDIFIEEEH
ncbi:MAG: hypothetical protein IT221_15500 [Fluviicola sp.]|nr:hypothetical protein [Fluviicola sp.]